VLCQRREKLEWIMDADARVRVELVCHSLGESAREFAARREYKRMRDTNEFDILAHLNVKRLSRFQRTAEVRDERMIVAHDVKARLRLPDSG
jgi:hypothetical protein